MNALAIYYQLRKQLLPVGRILPPHQDQETKLQRYETGAIIYKALSFKNLDNPLRKANTACDRGRSDSVCCSDHRTKENGGSPIEAWQ